MTELRTQFSPVPDSHKIVTGGAVATAIASSACCWIPLLLMAFGLSASGLAAWFEEYRLIFLISAGTLLATGFYLVYFRKSACCDADGECETPTRNRNVLSQLMLWVATVLVVASATFPNYIGVLLADHSDDQRVSVKSTLITMSFEITGMTCEGCAAIVKNAITKVPGVVDATVSYPEGSAEIVTDPESPPDVLQIVREVRKAGYKIELLSAGLVPQEHRETISTYTGNY